MSGNFLVKKKNRIAISIFDKNYYRKKKWKIGLNKTLTDFTSAGDY